MFGLEFFAGIGGGVGLALIVWWVVDRQRAQNRSNDEVARSLAPPRTAEHNEGNATKQALRQGEER